MHKMNGILHKLATGVLTAIILCFAPFMINAEPILKKGDRLAIVGDSITAQKRYSRVIETYLRACMPHLDLYIMQFGKGSETARGLAQRMEYDLLTYNADVATLLYGMNDGGDKPYHQRRAKRFENGMIEVISRLKRAGVKIIVGATTVVDPDFFHVPKKSTPKQYNETLRRLSEISMKLAKKERFPFADIYNVMMDCMVRAKKKYGSEYNVAGKDGVHPEDNGHLIIAHVFLKTLGMNGDLGTIIVDMKGKSTAKGGHKIVSSGRGTVKIKSTRYPFCFRGKKIAYGSEESMLPFLPFNKDLNRLILKVKNLRARTAKVTWGRHSKSFSRRQLSKGINLAAEFLDNPFCKPFQEFSLKVRYKQEYDLEINRDFIKKLLEIEDEKERIRLRDEQRPGLLKKYEQWEQDLRRALKPVMHTITVKPE